MFYLDLFMSQMKEQRKSISHLWLEMTSLPPPGKRTQSFHCFLLRNQVTAGQPRLWKVGSISKLL